MKTTTSNCAPRWLRAGLLIVASVFSLATVADARTITFTLQFARLHYSILDNYAGNTYYTANILVSSDVPPVTYDEVASPDRGFVGTESGYGNSYYGDIDSAVNALTNGTWTLTVNKGDVSEKVYTFTVSSTSITTNNFPVIQITAPVDGDTQVPTNTVFTWSGPASWDELNLVDHNVDYSFYNNPFPRFPSTTTNWPSAPILPLGMNEFEVTYLRNTTPFTISTPVDNLSQPFANWVAAPKLFDFAQSGFVVTTNVPEPLGTGHTNIAHYAFDNGNNLGVDSSTNHNDINGYSSWGGEHVHEGSTNAIAGGGAILFFGDTSLAPNGQTFTNWTNALAGSFSVSLWINTTNQLGSDTDDMDSFTGQSVFYAANEGDSSIPLGLTGSKAAFLTGDPDGDPDTLHSKQSVTTGNYVHIVSTRNRITGEKKIYVNGALDNSAFASCRFLTGESYASIGGELFSSYRGLIDDLQIYSGVLSSNEVTLLYNHPGTNVTDKIGSTVLTLADALNYPYLTWTNTGDVPWFPETSTNHDTAAAAQSGVLTGVDQVSTLQTTVTGPGTFSFWWQVVADDEDFEIDFKIDDDQFASTGIGTDWDQQTYTVGSGPHTLTWTARIADSTNDTAWVDQFLFTPAPTITLLNPRIVGSNFEFSFLSIDAATHSVLYGTDLVLGNWQSYTTVFGDGTMKNVQIPLSVFSGAKQGFVVIQTQ